MQLKNDDHLPWKSIQINNDGPVPVAFEGRD
jgi:hypothetical protein